MLDLVKVIIKKDLTEWNLAIENVKVGREISKKDELKGYSVIEEAVRTITVRANISESDAIEIIKDVIKNEINIYHL